MRSIGCGCELVVVSFPDDCSAAKVFLYVLKASRRVVNFSLDRLFYGLRTSRQMEPRDIFYYLGQASSQQLSHYPFHAAESVGASGMV